MTAIAHIAWKLETTLGGVVNPGISVCVLSVMACGTQSQPPPVDPESAVIAATLRQLARETSDLFDSDRDCAEVVDRLAVHDAGYFVAQGRIIDAGTRDDRVRLCRLIRQGRLSAGQDVLEQRVELLGRDAAVIVTRGIYRIRYTDGRTMARPQVVTSVWSRTADGWRQVHLHESWQVNELEM